LRKRVLDNDRGLLSHFDALEAEAIHLLRDHGHGGIGYIDDTRIRTR
jgi:hypothetical protein